MYEIFEQLLQKNNVKASQVSKATGISTGSLSDWKMGRSTPKGENLQKIADFFGVSVDYMIGRNTETVNEDEKKRFSALISEYPEESIKAIAKLCKTERVNKDFTEKHVSLNSNVDLQEYLEFEGNHKNIGADHIINILSFLKLDISYITGFLTGTLIKVNDESEISPLLDRLLVNEDFKAELTLLLKEKSINIKEKYSLSEEEVNVIGKLMNKLIK